MRTKMMNKNLPRGLRNHNPLNIRKSSVCWQGMATVQSDKSFVTFVSNEYGYRAAFRILHTYITKHGLNTINSIIRRWAPPSENNTTKYIKTVVEHSGIDPIAKIYHTNKEHMVRIVSAMSFVENGLPANRQEVEEGYRLAFGF